MSDMDLNKLKVVELKAELQQRGLDTKGLKPVLIERLKEAIEKETQQGQPGDAAQEEGSNNGSLEGGGGDAEAEPEEEELDEEAEEAMLAEDQGPEVQEPEPVVETPKPEPKVAAVAAAAPPQQPAPVQSPPKAPVQSPPKAPVQSPAKAPLQSPQKVEMPPVVQQSPPKAPVVAQQQSPIKTPAPQQSPNKTPVPQQSPNKAPVPQQSPNKAPVPQQSPNKTPAPQQSPNKTPVPQQSPQKPAEALPAKQEPIALVKKEAEPVAANSTVKVAEAPVQAEQIKTEPMQTDDKKPEVKKEEERGKKRPHSPEAVKEVVPQEDEPEYDESKCLLSWIDSDLNLVIDKTDLLKAEPMTKLGFAYCWAGARASYGVKQGKAFFEVMIDKYLDVSHLENEANPNVLRVGWSVPSSSMQLGEEERTYGYGGTGKISTNCQFSDYGKPFQEGSVVGAFLDMSGETVTMSYTVDGEDLGVAFTVPKAELNGEPLFPHILTKNSSFSCNFGQDEPWFPPSDNSFSLIGKLSVDQDLVQGLKRPASKEECEVLMMVGVPACGKTHWVEKHVAENKQKHYTVLGTNNLIDKMKVMGLPRRKNYSGRWEELISTCTSCFNKLISVAATRRRNYILDQTNVYASARSRKMVPFKGFNRIAVVVVTSEEDLKKRTELQAKEEGKAVPNNSVLEMKANFAVPTKGDVFEEIRFVELGQEEASKMVEQYVKEANAAGVFKKDDTKHARFEQKPAFAGYRSNSGNTNSRYHSTNSNSRYGGGGGGGGGGDFRNPRFQGGGGGGGGFVRRDNREGGFRGGSGGGYRGASGGGPWRGSRDNRDNRDGRGFGARQDFSRRGGGGGDFRRDQKDYNGGRDRGYTSRPGGDRDRRDRYGGGSGAGSNWSGGSNYNSTGGGYAGGNSSYGSYAGNQQRNYNQNQYSGYSSYSSYPSQQQPQQQGYGSQSSATQNWTYGTTASAQQPQQQQSYSGGWQQYGQGGYGSQAAQTQQSYQQGYTGYQQNQSSGNYSTAQK